MNDRTKRIQELAAHLKAANVIYQELMLSAANDQERQDWAIDADDIERASVYASQESAR